MTDEREHLALPIFTLTNGHIPPVTTASWLGEGDFCFCYLVNGEYVLRFAKHATASAANVREACVLSVIAPLLSVAVPQPEARGINNETGEQLQYYPLVPGTILESEVLESLPPAVQASLIAQMADFMRQVHAIPLEAVSACGIPTFQTLTHFGEVMERARDTLRPHLTDAVWNHHEALLARATANPRFDHYTPVLLHGDLSPDHFLADLDTGKLTGVIDFGDVCIGDPAWDFVYILEDYGADVLTAFLAHYDSDNAAFLAEKVRTYQHLNNVAYGVSALAEGNDDDFAEAMAILTEQAR
nr:Phosphotransferase enzyme family [uncultured bacterium]